MNEHDDHTPAFSLLDGLRPVAPSADLMQRLIAARPASRTPQAKAKVISFFPLLARAAVVATIAGTATWFLMADKAPQANPTTTPVAAASAESAPQQSLQRLLGMRDLGFARDAQQRPVRLMHATWLDDNTYVPSNGAPPVREARVRDEIVPVVLNTY